MINCPNCNGRAIGRVGNEQFTVGLALKFSMTNGKMEILILLKMVQ